MTHALAVLTTSLLFGGMTLYSFGFAAFLFKAMAAPAAGATLRLTYHGDPFCCPFKNLEVSA